MDDALIDLLREDLERAGYDSQAVRGLLGPAADDARQRGVLAPARRVLDARGESPLGTLIRLFLLGDPLAGSGIDDALPTVRAAGLAELGLVEATAAGFRAALSLNPVDVEDAHLAQPARWWIISDLDDQLRRGPARPDHVMGVGGATRSLLAQAPPGETGSALDLGTGCGVVALHLVLRTRGRVVATDISERALVLARANARLNGLADRIDFRSGSLFEPVAGERFELILSNPPFVVTPRQADGAPRYVYRDGGMAGDELAAAVVRGAPGHLAGGGTLLCLANWESHWGVDGLERVGEWIEDAAAGSELAAWVVERDRVDTVRYAETWARDGGARPGEAGFERLMRDWLDDFAERRVVALGLGSIRLRRLSEVGTGGPVLRAERAEGAFSARPGARLAAAFEAAIETERMSDEEVLSHRWQLAEDAVEIREHRPGEESPRAIAFAAEGGIARRVSADPLLAGALGACDGELSLGRIADALATLLEADPAAVREALCADVRELVWLGLLAPAGR